MTKDDFLKWLSQYKFVGYYRRLVEERRFSEAELDFLTKNLEPHAKLRKANARRMGA